MFWKCPDDGSWPKELKAFSCAEQLFHKQLSVIHNHLYPCLGCLCLSEDSIDIYLHCHFPRDSPIWSISSFV